jgi:hypothetical protein
MMRELVVAACLVACGGDRETPYDYANNPGAAIYQAQCSVCHGEIGEGGLGPTLLDTKRSVDELRSTISQRMPANNPGQCSGQCADQVAAFIKDGLTTKALACDVVPPGPRRLRLLTRREYAATVATVFGDGAPAMACAKPTACAFTDTCNAGVCEPTACDSQTFVYDPQGRALASVHVAGDFNSWAPTIAAGGLALTFSTTTGQWSGTFPIPAGAHQYKLVLDQRDWVADPRAPSQVSDGFGGNNSAFTLRCEASLASVPAEVRPQGFPFDTDADAAVVTAPHVDAYLAAATPLADHAAESAQDLHACSWSATPAACKQELIAKLGRRLFRRPLEPGQLAAYAELELATALHAMLVSPHFLYRSELGVSAGDHYRLTDHEVAAALSFGLLGTTPDDGLLDAADRGELSDAAGVEAWARTLIDDPRARTQLGEYALQWVGGQTITGVDKRVDLFPDFDASTRRALADETRRFAGHVAYDGSGRFEELITADYTVLDAVAARFYGLSSGGGGKIAYDGKRAGVLGHASLLATTAHSDQTSPIRRGLLIRRNLLCEDLPPPPPFAGGVPDVDPDATTRERFAMHTDNEVCASCHRYIDGVGFGLEHFDPVGRWRTTENGHPIDATGDLTDVERLGSGTSAPYSTLPELAEVIANSRAASACFVRQYLRFSRGLRETLAQRCDRLWVQREFDAANHDIRELLVNSVLAPGFRARRGAP